MSSERASNPENESEVIAPDNSSRKDRLILWPFILFLPMAIGYFLQVKLLERRIERLERIAPPKVTVATNSPPGVLEFYIDRLDPGESVIIPVPIVPPGNSPKEELWDDV